MAFSISSVRRLIVFPVSLHPLKDKNFAPFLFGSFLSSIGFWVQSVGQSWQVLQLTNSAFLLGLVVFAAMVPNIVLSLFGGVIADRVNRRPLLIGTQSIFLCTAALLGILTTLHIITVWQIILMALINGTFNTVGIPAWQAFIGDLLELEQLKQGIALNSMQFSLSRVIGPSLGGFSIDVFGCAHSFYLNAISYVAVIISLILIHPRHRERTSRQQGMWQDLREGLSFARKRSSLRMILLLQFIIAFLVFPYIVLLPIFARDIFHIGAPGLGVLNSASGIGALSGAILLVVLSQHLKRGKSLLVLLCVLGGFASLAFAVVNVLNVAILLLIALGACTVMSMTSTNTALQLLTPEHMRGRILSLWVMTALGLAPFGNLLAGWVAQSIGAPSTLAIGGVLCACGALFIAAISKGRKLNAMRSVSSTRNIS